MNNEDFAVLGTVLLMSSIVLFILGVRIGVCVYLGAIVWLGAIGCFITALIYRHKF